MTPLNPIVEALVCRLDDNLREAFEERAGIFQFEAGQPRELAEPLALLDVVRLNPLAVAGLVCLRAMLEGAPVFAIGAEEVRARSALALLGASDAHLTDLPMALAHLGGTVRLTTLS